MDGDPPIDDVSRRTWLAAERTWLAWWRTGVAVGAVGLAVGRFLPDLTHRARWPFRILGIAYALLSVAVLVIGAIRQRRAADALRQGTLEPLSSSTVAWLTAGAVALSVVSIVLVAAVI